MARTTQHRPTSRDDFEIAIVCALTLEFDAVCALFDEIWDEDYGRTWGDANIYTNGRIGKFNVVLLKLSDMGKVSAAIASAHLRSSYSSLSLVLLTGICGGVPFPGAGKEILLGDVVVSRHIVQYDLGRQYPEGFETKDTVEDRFGRAPPNIRHLLSMLETIRARERAEELTAGYLLKLQQMTARKPGGIRYDYPGASQDIVFDSSYRHKRRFFKSLSCKEVGCDFKNVKSRERIQTKQELEKRGETEKAQAPSLFVGTIGSADTVMKSAEKRDRIARAHSIIAFEMEGAGLWETPCVVVKAVCDYADSHKNKEWQNFAAATAASATKALLDFYPQRDALRRSAPI
ncbi:purine and uridine phosphorylase [Aspergillus eucalypticola CBS 122712]|uniref:Purine and uridine phosphorylase n=1 Tax=Aspergillus eucalypticola (strain CBS 122712 / IBT 29274) TaxID=1448314 RepID=A0A317V6U4_ASPEC|nr:purine and uridine phosphorylase [Aspergillus eucalypticola CBS 122712]PWY68778.1 purine and uridine phosphorylase [Aspergillus eucalypticola CBS 122712]